MQTEWTILQTQYDSYEKYSLVIKLLAIAIAVIAGIYNQIGYFVVLILAVLWLQDGIWKTFQARIESRLLIVESLIEQEDFAQACQFNRQFAENRLSGSALIKEYLCQSVRPTVAFPHVVLIALALAETFIA